MLIVWSATTWAIGKPIAASVVAADSAARAKANLAFQQRDWSNVILAYQTIIREEQTNAMAWFRLGVAYHEMKQYEQSVEPLQRALQLGFQTTTATQRLARVYAMMNQKDKALDLLERAIILGFATTRQGFALEPELNNVRDDARYAGLVEKAERNVASYCDGIPEHRQFDFWIGEWDVRPFATPNAAPIARSIIERANGNCTIVENYYTKAGYTGKSFNIYDASRQQWRQFWNDNTGVVVEFFGVYDANEKALKYRSESLSASGQKSLGRMTFYRRDDGSVRQLWESSTDNGTTWSVLFDGLYTRKR